MKGTILALAAGIVAVALAASASAMSANRLVGSTGPDSAFNITLKKGKTKVTLHHAGMPAGPDLDGATQGWNEMFDKLVKHLEA